MQNIELDLKNIINTEISQKIKAKSFLSLGKNYDGSTISKNHDAEGIQKPVYAFIPSIGTCGITFINGTKFKSWSGDLIVSGLASQKLHRCIVKDNQIIKEEIISQEKKGYQNFDPR